MTLQSTQNDENQAELSGMEEVEVRQGLKSDKMEGSGFPLDVPSPLLLGSSMVLAIASTGE